MAEEWGPWVEHDGKGCPVPQGTWVQGRDRAGRVETWRALTVVIGCGAINAWAWTGRIAVPGDVMRYRVRRPDALRRLVDLAADPDRGLPPPARELVEAME